MLVISDIHLYMYHRIKILESCDTAHSDVINEVYNKATITYLEESIEEAIKEDPLTPIVFLGDIIDSAYINEEQLYEFKILLKKYSVNKKIIIMGNHDTSSYIPANKVKRSGLRYLTDIPNIEFITDTKLEIVNTKVLIYWSFTMRKKMHSELLEILYKVKEITTLQKITDIILFTHNNIYLADTFFLNKMFPLKNIIQMLDNAQIDKSISFTLINGHIHATHYEIIQK